MANNSETIKLAKARLLRIGQAVRDCGYISGEPVSFGVTPEVLVRLGLPQLPVVVPDPKKFFQIVGKGREGRHEISPETLSEVPEALHSPLAVFASKTQGSAFVVVTELQDGEGKPVIVAIHINARLGRTEINRIASIYGKDNAARVFLQWADEGLLKYLDTNKPDALQSAGLQLPLEGLRQAHP